MADQITRKEFIQVSLTTMGALLIASCAPEEIENQATPSPTSIPESEIAPNLFVKISSLGIVTLTIARSEMGQGVRTSLAMILAEELGANWQDIRVEQAPADPAFGSQLTGGSTSIMQNYLLLILPGYLNPQRRKHLNLLMVKLYKA